jgi:hypothetical protein
MTVCVCVCVCVSARVRSPKTALIQRTPNLSQDIRFYIYVQFSHSSVHSSILVNEGQSLITHVIKTYITDIF